MKSVWALVVCAGIVMLASLGSGVAQDEKKDGELAKEIKALREEVAKVSQRLDGIEKTLQQVLSKLEKPSSKKVQSKEIDDCVALINNCENALRVHERDMNQFPPSGNAEMVKALMKPGPKKMPYCTFTAQQLNSKGEVLDPWGNPLVYINCVARDVKDWKPHNKMSVDLYSFGPDGKDDKGDGDDITNWGR